MSLDDIIIAQPKGTRTIVLRESYLAICQDNKCAAQLLSALERWYGYKLKERTQARHRNAVAQAGGEIPEADESLWVYMSNDEWVGDLLQTYSDQTVRKGLALLVNLGFILTRSNPKKRWDRKPQWMFLRARVQAAVDAWGSARGGQPDLDPGAVDDVSDDLAPEATTTREKYRDDSVKLPNGVGETTECIRQNYRSNTTAFFHSLPSQPFNTHTTPTPGADAPRARVQPLAEEDLTPGERQSLNGPTQGAASGEAEPGQDTPVQVKTPAQASEETGQATGLEKIPAAAGGAAGAEPASGHWAMVHAVTEAVYAGVPYERIPKSVRGQVGKAARELCGIGLPVTAPAEILKYIQREETWRTGKITPMTLASCAADWQRTEQQRPQGAQIVVNTPTPEGAGCLPGERRRAPDGLVWTVEAIEHGRVTFAEYDAPAYTPTTVVSRWTVEA